MERRKIQIQIQTQSQSQSQTPDPEAFGPPVGELPEPLLKPLPPSIATTEYVTLGARLFWLPRSWSARGRDEERG